MIHNSHKEDGFVAIMSAVVIGVILLALTFSVSFTGFFARFNVLDSEYKKTSLALAEGCVDVALLKVAADPTYTGPEPITIGANTCQILQVAANTPSTDEFTIRTKAIYPASALERAFTYLEVIADDPDALDITSWKECPTDPTATVCP